MNTKTKAIAAFSIAGLVLGGAYLLFGRQPSDVGASIVDGAQTTGVLSLTPEQMAGLALETGIVERRRIAAELSLPGRIEEDRRRSFTIAPIVAAVIDDVAAVEHDRVQKGQILARLRSDALGEAQAGYLDALARFRLAEAERKRVEGLWKESIVSESRWLQVDSDYKRAAAALEQQRRLLKLAGLDDRQIADIEEHPDRLAVFDLVSPADGIVVESTAVSGKAIAAGEKVFRVIDPSQLWVDVRIPTAYIGDVVVGAAALVDVQLSSRQRIRGEVLSLGADVDPQSQTVEGRIVVENPEGLLRPGMFAGITLSGRGHDGLAVPASAVTRQGNRSHVFKVVGPGQFMAVAIDAGAEMAGWIPVLAGLEEGMPVVIKGVAELKGQWLYQGGE